MKVFCFLHIYLLNSPFTHPTFLLQVVLAAHWVLFPSNKKISAERIKQEQKILHTSEVWSLLSPVTELGWGGGQLLWEVDCLCSYPTAEPG